ncbi:MAG: ROK family protein [Erysipelotrichaceae bacterium]|jgi:cellobiose-specific phosphotransferase system component IIB|nr:ROK family protein [Erysipelotrichaceae bacterium]
MEEEIQEELVQQFCAWIRTQQRNGCTYEYQSSLITICTACARAEIRFYEKNIIEFRILSLKSEENIFYLHFQLKEIHHAHELFHEMMTALLAYNEERMVKVLLCCTSALTTSYFAEQLNRAAKVLALNYIFEAVSYDRVYEKGLYYDMILVAPQIGFQEKKIHNAMKEIPILTIPAAIFGKYDTGAMIALIQKTLRQKRPQPTKAEAVAKVFENSAKILCICVFNSSKKVRTIYRYYRNGKIVTEGEIKKKNVQVSDVMDIIDTMVAVHPEIEAIGLTMPGIEVSGRLHLPEQGIKDEDIALEIYHKYNRICILSNDCNQVAYGICSLDEHYKNLIFNFQPYGYSVGGAGIVANGELVRGKGNGAGELKTLINALSLSRPAGELAKTADGTYEILAKTIACEISLLSPEAVYVHSAMAPDIEHLKELVSSLAGERAMPDMFYINDMREYMMVGTMLKSIEWYDKYTKDEWDETYYWHK